MGIRCQLFVFFMCIFSIGSGLSKSSKKLELIEELINEVFIPINHISGMSLSVVQDGQIFLSKGYGKMDIENDEDARNDTVFALASIAKSFTATLAVKVLSERFPSLGASVLDLPIATIHPTFNFTFSDRYRSEQMSFRDLMSHRHCLIDEVNDLVFGGVKSNAEYNYRTRYQVEACGHRVGGYYNNALATLAGDILASLEGIPYHELLKNFMQEIGMEDSTTIDTEGSFEINPKMSQGYYRRGGQFHKLNRDLLRRVHIETAAGGLLSTSNDMAKYSLFHLNKGRVGDRQIISEEAMSWLHEPALSVGALPGKQEDADPVTGQYALGFGFGLSLHDGYAAAFTGGSWPSFVSYNVIFPAKNIGVFLTTNGPGELLPEFDHIAVAHMLFDIMRGVTNATELKSTLLVMSKKSRPTALAGEFGGIWNFDNSRALRKAALVTDFGKLFEFNFENVTGVYGDEGAGDLTISIDSQDPTFLQISFGMGEWSVGRLLPTNESEALFLIEWTSDIEHHFYSYPEELYPTPVFHVVFHPDSVFFLFNGALRIVFIKDATVETFPVIPWDPTSCGPTAL